MAGSCIVTAAQMSWADRQTMAAGSGNFELMDRAGRAVASSVLTLMPDSGRVLIIAGPGNNGGDGFAVAWHLRQRRVPVTVVMLFPEASLGGACLEHAGRAKAAGAKLREASDQQGLAELERWLARSVLAVDAIFGTGLSRCLEGHYAAAVDRLNRWERPVLSIDIASGLEADTGCVLGTAVRADWTLPIAACKWGHWLGDGRDCSGRVLEAAAIGISTETLMQAYEAEPDGLRCASLIDEDVLDAAWPPRPRISHKGDYGHVWVFGGSIGFTGAPALAARGAFAAGAGLVSIVCPDEAWPVVAADMPEVMTHPQSSEPWDGEDARVGAVVAGPGWGKKHADILQRLLATDCPLVLDADALNMIADDEALQQALEQRTAISVITPHPGEAARLLQMSVQEVQRDRKHALLNLIRRYRCRVVLKGNETLIGSPDGMIFLSPFGSPQMAVAGCGDVLAGMIGAQLVAAHARQDATAVAAAVALHGLAGEEHGWHLAGELTTVIARLRQSIERRHESPVCR